MTVTKDISETKVVISIEGRVDSTTAPDFEKAISTVINTGNENVVFDFSKLEYISSAGLRVILSAQKRLAANGSLVLKNVNDVVYNVFEVTGFSEILKIER